MRDIIRKKKVSTPRVTFNRLKINNVNIYVLFFPGLLCSWKIDYKAGKVKETQH